MILKGRTRHLVEAYLKQLRELLGKAGPDLVAFLDHIKKRVLLDRDPPDVRQGMCIVAVMACNDLVSAGKKLARGHDVTQYEQMAELFDQIAEGPEVTVELEDEHGSQRVTMFKDGARTGMTPAARALRREDVIWSFKIGPDSSFVRDPPVGYVQIAAAEGLEWFELSSAGVRAAHAVGCRCRISSDAGASVHEALRQAAPKRALLLWERAEVQEVLRRPLARGACHDAALGRRATFWPLDRLGPGE